MGLVNKPEVTSVSRSPPPLHCLLAFESAARHRNLAKAAGELRLKAPAVAQSIALLEDRVQVQLVRSLVPVVELTEAGDRYFRSVQQFATQLRDGLFERFPIGRTQLRVGASQALSRLWLAPRIVSFVQRHPRIDLVLTTTERFERVHDGGVDVALRYGGGDDDGVVSLPMWNDRLLALAAPGVARDCDGLSARELVRSMPRVDHPSASWQRWLAGLEADASVAPARLTCTDLHLAIEAAVQGLGVVIAPERVVDRLLAEGALRPVSAHSVPAKPYRALVSQRQQQRLAVRLFLDWLHEQCRPQPGSPAG